MFLVNLAHRWNLASADDWHDGVVYLASGSDRERLRRSARKDFTSVLFDPQLYLADLEAGSCTRVCARLASYPWFASSNLPEFDSADTTYRDWMKTLQAEVIASWVGEPPVDEEAIAAAAEAAVAFQVELGCTHIILPSPLVVDPEDEAAAQSKWLDLSLSATSDLDIGQPILATVALHESVLTDGAFGPGGLLDVIADQVTARSGLDGVYFLIEQALPQHPFDTRDRVLRAYVRLSVAFANATYEYVIPNFADVHGLICEAAGATGFATGASQSQRRLSAGAFRDEGGGIALPHFYSHGAACELMTEQDLDRIVAKKMLSRVRDDTPHSHNLMSKLAQGGSAADVPQWAESQNNLTAAHKHFLRRLAEEESTLIEMGVEERADVVRDWLNAAEGRQRYLATRLGKVGLVGRQGPVERWLNALDAD